MTNKTKLELSERDFLIFSELERWGILGVGQLTGLEEDKGKGTEEKVRLLFNETVKKDYWTRFYKRVEQLREAAYLQAHHQPKVYLLTEKGHRALRQAGRAKLTSFRDEISEHLVGHELRVAGVGLMLERVLGYPVRAVRERQVLKRGGWQAAAQRGVPDLWIPGEPLRAIEIELHQKGQAEYEEIWSSYRLRLRGKGVVLYLTTMPEGVTTLLRLARQFEADFIYVCDFTEFRQSFGRAPFKGFQEGRRIILEPRKAPAHPLGRLSPPADRTPALSPALLSQGGFAA